MREIPYTALAIIIGNLGPGIGILGISHCKMTMHIPRVVVNLLSQGTLTGRIVTTQFCRLHEGKFSGRKWLEDKLWNGNIIQQKRKFADLKKECEWNEIHSIGLN